MLIYFRCQKCNLRQKASVLSPILRGWDSLFSRLSEFPLYTTHKILYTLINCIDLTRQKQKDEVTPYLVDALSSHPAAKGREVKHYSIPIVCIPEYPERVSNF